MAEGNGDGNLVQSSTKSTLMETDHDITVQQTTPINAEPIDLASNVTDISDFTSNSESNMTMHQDPNQIDVLVSLMETEHNLPAQTTPLSTEPTGLASNVTDISESSSNSVSSTSLHHDPSQPDLVDGNSDQSALPSDGLVTESFTVVPNSLSVIANYGSDSYDSDEADNSNCKASVVASVLPAPPAPAAAEYRTVESDSEDSETDSSKSSEDESSSTSSSDSSNEAGRGAKTLVKPTAKGESSPKEKRGRETTLEDLPPIEDLQITVPENSCQEMGFIASIVEQQVVVQAKAHFPPLNLETVLFLDHGQRPLGSIFDVLGQVSEPLYTVRFNSAEHIKQKNIEPGMAVFCAPHSEHTNFVFMDELLKMKGTDQGWDPTSEPVPDCLDFSDDEAERNYRRSQETARSQGSEMDWDAPPRKRVNSFERRMNERNLRKSALPPEPHSLFTGFVQRAQRAHRGRNPAGGFAGLSRGSRPSSGPVFPSPASSTTPVYQPRSSHHVWDSGNEQPVMRSPPFPGARSVARMRSYCFPPPSPAYNSFCVGLSPEQIRYHNPPGQIGGNTQEHMRYRNVPTQAAANPDQMRYRNPTSSQVGAGAQDQVRYRSPPTQAAANAQVAALALAYSMGAPSSPMYPAGYPAAMHGTQPRGQAYPVMLRPAAFSTSPARYEANSYAPSMPFNTPPPSFPPCYPPQGPMRGQPYSPMFSGVPIFNPGFPPPQMHPRANIYPVVPHPPPRGGV